MFLTKYLDSVFVIAFVAHLCVKVCTIFRIHNYINARVPAEISNLQYTLYNFTKYILHNLKKRADLLAPVGNVYFPMWYPGSGVVLDYIVSLSLPLF